MQVRHSELIGDRPQCPLNPHHTIHRHGDYERFADCDTPKREAIARFLCVPCGHTISVLPDAMLPYRPVPVPLVQSDFDARAEGTPAPAVTEKERGCLKRAWERFTQRVEALTSRLGQMMQIRIRGSKPCWLALRWWGNLAQILHRLSRSFKISLLHDYRCLRPWDTS